MYVRTRTEHKKFSLNDKIGKGASVKLFVWIKSEILKAESLQVQA